MPIRIASTSFELPYGLGHPQLLQHIQKAVSGDGTPIRFAIVKSEANKCYCEIDRVYGDDLDNHIFDFYPRQRKNGNQFNVVLVIPTGIGAEIGGHAGDAGPIAKLLGGVCDTLITHPNVVNASDINELPANALYVEGSVLSKFMMGAVGLGEVRANRLLVVIDQHEDARYIDATVNSVNAARACWGLDCTRVVVLKDFPVAKSTVTASGRVVGELIGLETLCNVLEDKDYDAIALSSRIDIPREVHDNYYAGVSDILNPWGGIEAMLTHFISLKYNVPTAHAPMLESREIELMEMGVVDPRMAAEVISMTFFQSVLKGLHRSPRIVPHASDGMAVEDVSCLVIPEKCVGLPTLAALAQGVSVIAVRENTNIMQNDLSELPWADGQFHSVANYWEAAGVLTAMRQGMTPQSVRRPLPRVQLTNHKT